MSSQRYVKQNSVDTLTNKIPNSPTQKRQVSLPCSDTALVPPSFPSIPGPSILIDSHLEDPLTEETYARRWTGQQSTTGKQRQRMSSAPHLAKTAYRLDAM